MLGTGCLNWRKALFPILEHYNSEIQWTLRIMDMLGAGILSFKALIMEIKRKVNVLNLQCGLYSEVLFSIVSLTQSVISEVLLQYMYTVRTYEQRSSLE